MSKALDTATSLRIPVWNGDETTARKVEDLESYICVTAYWQGDMFEERMGLRRELDGLLTEWEGLTGWEPFKRNKTEAAVDDAKRQLRPELHADIAARRRTIGDLAEQIDRMEREFTKASRVYTLLTGS